MGDGILRDPRFAPRGPGAGTSLRVPTIRLGFSHAGQVILLSVRIGIDCFEALGVTLTGFDRAFQRPWPPGSAERNRESGRRGGASRVLTGGRGRGVMGLG